MFIEEIVLDGFKSYSTRTVVSGFDKQFNAITGLNGSGKSNILDAICFVLGISNLAQVHSPPSTLSFAVGRYCGFFVLARKLACDLSHAFAVVVCLCGSLAFRRRASFPGKREKEKKKTSR
jgi:hypothetical protein